MGPDAVGGAEQVLSAIDQALVRQGHRSIVVACRGSTAAGEWIDTGVDPEAAIDDAHRAAAQDATRQAVATASREADLVHLHGLDFHAVLPPAGPAALVTLHLPLRWYPAPAWSDSRPRTWMHGVSAAQTSSMPLDPNLLPPIANGVPVDELQRPLHAKRTFALTLGRVCAEKGQHLALRAAHSADAPLLIGGAVFGYDAHRSYFEQEVTPLLDRRRRFLGPLTFARKRRLLAAARCLLISSQAETSSLVAMEAAACGTPVIAFRAGALPDIVVDGVTGFVVDDASEMADRMRDIGDIDPQRCRRHALAHFSLEPMTGAYIERYHRLIAS